MSKFLFQTTFDSGAAVRRARNSEIGEEELANATAAARAEGYAQGVADTRRDAENQAADALAGMSGQIGKLLGTLETRLAAIEAEAARVAHLLASKIAPALMQRHPVAEVEAMLRAVLRDQGDEPRLVVRASETVVDHLRERIDTLTAAQGFAGAVILLPDDSMRAGDCRVEWADGGAERNPSSLTSRIDEIVKRHLNEASL
jgi:flagellar assembly protein FliH